ncbi:MAG: glycoside hydrolase domain-containing protein [Acidobacteriota bacterium]
MAGELNSAVPLIALCLLMTPGLSRSQNLVTNGGFENGTTGWEGGLIDKTSPHSGKACLRVDDDSPREDIAAYTPGIIPVTHGRAYLFEVWCRCPQDDQELLVSLNQYDGSGDWISGNNQDFVVVPGTTWKRFRIAVRAFHPDTAGLAIFLRPVLWTESGDLTGTAWFDDVRFTEQAIEAEVRGVWIKKDGGVAAWLSPVEQKVRRDAVLDPSAGARKEIAIAAAAGEFEPFQLVLAPRSKDEVIEVSPGDLRGPGGAVVAGSELKVHEVAYVSVTQPTDVASLTGWTPDPLPLFRAPLPLTPGAQQPLWFDVHVPSAATPGEYRGTVLIRFRSGARVVIPVRLRVWDFDMPRERHLRTAYGLWLDLIDRYHHLGNSVDKRRRTLRLYLRDFADHRISTYNPFGDDGFEVSVPGWNWMDGKIVPDPDAPGLGNCVLEVNDDDSEVAVSVRSEIAVAVRHGVGYALRWRAHTDGAHDYLVSVNQYDWKKRWIPGHNIDFQRTGAGEWQSGSAEVSAGEITRSTAFLRIHLYARRWTEEGELTGRTWFDDVAMVESGTTANLVANGDFQLTPEQAEIRVDFSRFDQAAEYALDELGSDSFMLDLPHFASGWLGEYYLPRFLGYDWGTAEYEAAFGRMLRIITDHLAARGWLDRAYTYWYDEPEPETYPVVVEGMQILHRAEPRLQRLLTEQFEPKLAGHVDIWSPVLDLFRRDWAQERQAAGEEVWWYVCTGPKAPYPNDFIDHPGIEHRIRYWMAWHYKVQGDLFWQTNYWTCDEVFPRSKPQDPWIDPQSYNSDGVWGNGDGRLLYPPRNWKDGKERIEGPTPSIRWELIREGIEDYEYFWLLKDCADRLERLHKAPGIVRRARDLAAIPSSVFKSTTEYTDDPVLLHTYRQSVAETIEDAIRAMGAGR